MTKTLVITLVCVLAGTGGAYCYLVVKRGPSPGPGNRSAVQTGLCEKHQVEEARCPFCNPALVANGGQCQEHGVAEALCFRCRPELASAFQAEGDWCATHGVPESQCAICQGGSLPSEPKPGTPQVPAAPLSVEPDAPDEVTRIRRSPSVTCTKERSVVRLASAETARGIGLESEPVRRQNLHETCVVNAEVTYDATYYVRLSSRAAGVVVAVNNNVGDAVQRGQVLAIVDSADLGSAKAAALAASAGVRLWEQNHRREQRLLAQGIATEQEALETETKLMESQIELGRAQQRLRNLGLSAAQIDQLEAVDDASALLELTAPFAGTVVERAATVGEVVDTTQPLLAVADTSRMWAMLDLSQDQLKDVQEGQPVVLTIDGLRGETFAGQVAAISHQADPRTRTIKARAEVENGSGLLRANSFGRAEISIRNGAAALLVPRAAVQWDGCCNVVFVRESATLFRPRKVRLGVDPGDHYEVLAGLDGRETVVTQGSFLLKTELLKDSIGAGCCEVDHLAK